MALAGVGGVSKASDSHGAQPLAERAPGDLDHPSLPVSAVEVMAAIAGEAEPTCDNSDRKEDCQAASRNL